MKKTSNLNAFWRPIFWIIVLAYLTANIYLLYLGQTNGVIIRLAFAAYFALLIWLTGRITNPLPPEETENPPKKLGLGSHVVVLSIVILLTGLSSHVVPIWSDLVAWFYNLGESLLPAEWFGGPGNSVANPIQFFVIPFILLSLLGTKPVDLGMGKGHKVWQTCLIWLALPMVIWIGLLLAGVLSAQTLTRRLISNTFQNGFFEEFLFRGALQTYLQSLLPMPSALTIQALLFGFWHLRANIESMDGNVLAGLALCLVSQTVSGLVYGVVFQRTRNLIAPSIAHVAMNVLGQSLG